MLLKIKSLIMKDESTDTTGNSNQTEREKVAHSDLEVDQQREHSSRGVSFTIDAIFMALFLMAGLVITIAIAPDPGAEAEQDVEELQFQSEIDDLWAIAEARNNMTNSVLYWDDSAGAWANSGGSNFYTTLPPDHPLKEMTEVLDNRGMNYGITVEYLDQAGNTRQTRLVHQGTPGTEAVVASQSFEIEEGTKLVGPDDDTNVEDANTYFAPNAFPESETYNIFTVYLVVWQV